MKALMALRYRVDRVLILPIYRAIRRLHGERPSTDEMAPAIVPVAEDAGDPE